MPFADIHPYTFPSALILIAIIGLAWYAIAGKPKVTIPCKVYKDEKDSVTKEFALKSTPPLAKNFPNKLAKLQGIAKCRPIPTPKCPWCGRAEISGFACNEYTYEELTWTDQDSQHIILDHVMKPTGDVRYYLQPAFVEKVDFYTEKQERKLLTRRV